MASRTRLHCISEQVSRPDCGPLASPSKEQNSVPSSHCSLPPFERVLWHRLVIKTGLGFSWGNYTTILGILVKSVVHLYLRLYYKQWPQRPTVFCHSQFWSTALRYELSSFPPHLTIKAWALDYPYWYGHQQLFLVPMILRSFGSTLTVSTTWMVAFIESSCQSLHFFDLLGLSRGGAKCERIYGSRKSVSSEPS